MSPEPPGHKIQQPVLILVTCLKQIIYLQIFSGATGGQ